MKTRPRSRASRPFMIDLAIERVRAHAAAKKLAPSRLAVLAGLHKNALSRFLDPDWNPRAATLRALERAAGAS